MRTLRLFCGLVFLISPFISSGQAQPLAQSRHTSYYTYILKLNKQQAENFNFWDYLTPKNFINIVDSFPTDSSYRKTLPEGNYLYVKAKIWESCGNWVKSTYPWWDHSWFERKDFLGRVDIFELLGWLHLLWKCFLTFFSSPWNFWWFLINRKAKIEITT